MWSTVSTGEPFYAKVTELNGAASLIAEADDEPEATTDGPSTHYEVDQILNRRYQDGVEECLVSWVGYGPTYNSWEPVKELQRTASTALERYNRKPSKNGSLHMQLHRDVTTDADREGEVVQVQWLTRHIIDNEGTDAEDEYDDTSEVQEAFYSPALEAMAAPSPRREPALRWPRHCERRRSRRRRAAHQHRCRSRQER